MFITSDYEASENMTGIYVNKIINRIFYKRRIQFNLLMDGVYNIFFKADEDGRYILKSLLAVKTNNNNLGSFRRVSREKKEHKFCGTGRQGITSGIMYSSNGKAIFIGVDVLNNHSVSMMVGEGVNKKDIILGGTAIVNAPHEYNIKRFAICEAPRHISIREAFSDTMLHAADSESVPSVVREYLGCAKY